MVNENENNQNHKKEIDSFSGVETTGHEWDGLRELNNPAPRWWLWVFFVSCIFAFGYWYFFPSWPTFSNFMAGSKNWSEYKQLVEDQKAIKERRAKYEEKFNAASLEQINNDTELYNYAKAGGEIAFKNNCAVCHGAGGQGGKGFPILIDDHWLFGGTLDQIYKTITYGAHNENENSHQGNMPAWKEQLKPQEIEDAAVYVSKLSEGEKAEKTEAYTNGQKVFAANCAACHGENGEGNTELGAPALRDGIFQWGSAHQTLVQTITYGRMGVMPAWEGRLSDSTIKQLTIYVHSLGGGK